MENKYDVVIIGAGPAGMTAAVYASRANLKTVFIEKGAPGGKMVTTSRIENWIGDKSVTGPELSLRMFEHSKAFGAEYKYGTVASIKSNSDQEHIVVLSDGSNVLTKTVIIATGMVERVPMEVEGIVEFNHRGVSYCAICDGPLYKGLPVSVIGGGDSAIEESIYLSQVASKVNVFVRNDISSQPKLLDELKTKDNVKIYLKTSVKKIIGEKNMEKLIVKGPEGKQEIESKALFPYIGLDPVSGFVKNLGIVDENGFIPTDEFMETKIKGIYAIGDIRKKDIRQIATATSDGAIAGKIIANRL